MWMPSHLSHVSARLNSLAKLCHLFWRFVCWWYPYLQLNMVWYFFLHRIQDWLCKPVGIYIGMAPLNAEILYDAYPPSGYLALCQWWCVHYIEQVWFFWNLAYELVLGNWSAFNLTYPSPSKKTFCRGGGTVQSQLEILTLRFRRWVTVNSIPNHGQKVRMLYVCLFLPLSHLTGKNEKVFKFITWKQISGCHSPSLPLDILMLFLESWDWRHGPHVSWCLSWQCPYEKYFKGLTLLNEPQIWNWSHWRVHKFPTGA